jgi:hypothetical protein
MRAVTLLRIILAIEIVAFVGATMAVTKDYQDSWILTGLEVPFALFVLTYVVYFFADKNTEIKWIILFALIFRSVVLLVPNLKYVWFQGVDFDEHDHFRLIQDIYDKGYIPVGRSHSGTPFMHLLSAAYSITTGSSVLFTFKYLPIISWLVFPLVIYSVLKLVAPRSPSLLKYAVFVSSVPVVPVLSYVVTGTTFGTLLTILFFSQFIKAVQTKVRNHALVAIIFGFILVFAHSYSVTILTTGLLMTYLASRSSFVRNKLKAFEFVNSRFKNFLIFLIVLNAAWLMFSATIFFLNGAQIVQQWVNAILGARATGRTFTDINWTFFSLSFANQLRIITVLYGGILFILFLTLLGILVKKKTFRSSKLLNFTSVFFLSVWLFFVVQLVFSGARAGVVEYFRILYFSYIFTPIFVGVLFCYLQRKLHGIKLNFLLSLLLILFATIQLYGCQPLLPIASSVRSNLPSDEYIIYVGNVNSAYQRYMIAYAEKHIGKGMIACDPVTENQILGLTDYSFSQSHLAGFYPFDHNITGEKIDYILIHLPGKSGWPGVKPEVGTKDFILGVTRNSSVLYSNGESFILTNPFMTQNTP